MRPLVRPYNQASDEAFVSSTFLKAMRYGNHFYEEMEKNAYFNNYSIALKQLLQKRQVNILCMEEDPDVILGYCISDPSEHIIDFIFIKSAWRKKGLTKLLIGDIIYSWATHFTKPGLAIMKAKNIKFDPWRL